MTPHDPPRAADALAQRLAEAGCRRAFGMPGGEVLTILDALKGAGIAFHLVAHENAGGFMAEGGHHMDGAPGVLVATVGPGALNAVNTVANAWQERVPLIVLTGCVDAEAAETYTHQVLDHRAVFAPVTKATFTLSADEADTIADKAVAAATEGRPGPVLIDVPIAVADAPAGPARRRRVPAGPVAPAGPDLDRARAMLDAAERPVIVAGLDLLNDGAADDLARAAARLGWPVVTSYKAKGVLSEHNALSLGGAGLSPRADKVLVPLLQSADTILLAGYDPIEMRPGWREIWDPSRQNVVEIAAAPNHHYMHQATLSFTCDTGAGLRALTDGLAAKPVWADGAIEDARTALDRAFPEDEDWGPAAVIAECRAALPPGTIATVDSGAHRILLSQMWRCEAPRRLLQSSGLCTMGCALPLAMGAKIAAPERTVVAFTGDGGLLMGAGELATLAETGLPVIVVVFVDASLALIELKQRQRQLANSGVDFARHDFAAVARAFGGAGHRVGSRAALRAALAEARTHDGFTLIAADIERGAYDGRI
ncbi:thiamine pyrophosphate-binding protein [Palleronia pelagia]|uniref:Acetolactate synthase-1/2/3 large subunit n=1 Tax=Palleronia pelagia TaxID=387096 RepID=A0A1H8INN1_9RHOB|nr:thiamine pyrophosphate-binding protein [Palleronia pelagia]SEN69999.1 acetolactate synthase-1/2/3 large subunit [Palleronia pelagia]